MTLSLSHPPLVITSDLERQSALASLSPHAPSKTPWGTLWTAEVAHWPQAWCNVAHREGWFATQGFRSAGERLHEHAVAQGLADGPYRSSPSTFERWWTQHDQPGDEGPYDLRLIVDDDVRLIGLLVAQRPCGWPRPDALRIDVPEYRWEAPRRRATRCFPALNLGRVMVWVHEAHRGQGVGQSLVYSLVQADLATVNDNLQEGPRMPYYMASDRALSLLRTNVTWPVVPHHRSVEHVVSALNRARLALFDEPHSPWLSCWHDLPTPSRSRRRP